MNIKSPEAHKLATELARIMGTSITEAVTKALREALDRQKESHRLRDVDAIVADMRTRYKTTKGFVDDLFDPETGLPK
ncbi:MAG: type II toxin-antitoxin system VapB family antitoxin [Fimbriimonadales bacterium]